MSLLGNLPGIDFTISKLAQYPFGSQLIKKLRNFAEILKEFNNKAMGSEDLDGAIEASEENLNNNLYKNAEALKGFRYDYTGFTDAFKQIVTGATTATAGTSNTVSASTTAGEYCQSSTQSQKTIASTFGNDILNMYWNLTGAPVDLTCFEDTTEVSRDNDYIVFCIFISDITKLQNHSTGGYALKIALSSHASTRTTDTAYITRTLAQLNNEMNIIRVRKAEFTTTGSFTWASVKFVDIYATNNIATAYLTCDNFYLESSVNSPFIVLDKADTANQDYILSTELDVLNLGTSPQSQSERFKDKLYDFFGAKLVIENDIVGGRNKEYGIELLSDSNVHTTSDMVEILAASSVSWKIKQPVWEPQASKHYYYKGSSQLRIGTRHGITASDSIILLKPVKPVSQYQNYRMLAKFSFPATITESQGIVFNYKDSSNYKRAYIYKNGASSSVKVDLVKGGVVTNWFTSTVFTMSDADIYYLQVIINNNRISLYTSSAGTGATSMTNRGYVTKEDMTLAGYYGIGLYANKELNFTSFKVSENSSISPTLFAVQESTESGATRMGRTFFVQDNNNALQIHCYSDNSVSAAGPIQSCSGGTELAPSMTLSGRRIWQNIFGGRHPTGFMAATGGFLGYCAEDSSSSTNGGTYMKGATCRLGSATRQEFFTFWYDGTFWANGYRSATVTKSSAYTITTEDSTVVGNTTSSSFTLTLPDAASCYSSTFKHGQKFTIKKSAAANILTIGTTSSQLIDGFTTLELTAQYSTVTVQSNGTGWDVIARGILPNRAAINPTAKTSAYTFTTEDSTIKGDTTSGSFTVTLLDAATCYNSNTKQGQIFTLKKTVAVNTLTLGTTGGQLIDGSTTQALTAQHSSFTVQSNGIGWDIIGKVS